MNYWVRERPSAANHPVYYVVLMGKKSCRQGEIPIHFPDWESAQRFANALQNNPPTNTQKFHAGVMNNAFFIKKKEYV